MILKGKDAKHLWTARFEPSEETHRGCITCGGQVRRSWVTGILHRRCRFCRYLVLMYGSSIEVERKDIKQKRRAA